MGNLLSPSHLLLVLLISLLLFGPSRLPELGRAVGRTLKEFKDGTRDAMLQEEKSIEQQEAENEQHHLR